MSKCTSPINGSPCPKTAKAIQANCPVSFDSFGEPFYAMDCCQNNQVPGDTCADPNNPDPPTMCDYQPTPGGEIKTLECRDWTPAKMTTKLLSNNMKYIFHLKNTGGHHKQALKMHIAMLKALGATPPQTCSSIVAACSGYGENILCESSGHCTATSRPLQNNCVYQCSMQDCLNCVTNSKKDNCSACGGGYIPPRPGDDVYCGTDGCKETACKTEYEYNKCVDGAAGAGGRENPSDNIPNPIIACCNSKGSDCTTQVFEDQMGSGVCGASSGGCKNDTDCASNQTCKNGNCVSSGGCKNDTDCASNQTCKNGNCVSNGGVTPWTSDEKQTVTTMLNQTFPSIKTAIHLNLYNVSQDKVVNCAVDVLSTTYPFSDVENDSISTDDMTKIFTGCVNKFKDDGGGSKLSTGAIIAIISGGLLLGALIVWFFFLRKK